MIKMPALKSLTDTAKTSHLKRIARTCLLVLVFLILAALAHAGDKWTGKVIGVTDGDTITVLRDQTQVKVRLYGIDCPEKGQSWGKRAKQFTEDKCLGQTVLVFARDTDRYGRLVAELMLTSQRILQHEMLKTGLAWWYEKYAPDENLYRLLEKQARRDRTGLWADPEPAAPWEWRKGKAKGEIVTQMCPESDSVG